MTLAAASTRPPCPLHWRLHRAGSLHRSRDGIAGQDSRRRLGRSHRATSSPQGRTQGGDVVAGTSCTIKSSFEPMDFAPCRSCKRASIMALMLLTCMRDGSACASSAGSPRAVTAKIKPRGARPLRPVRNCSELPQGEVERKYGTATDRHLDHRRACQEQLLLHPGSRSPCSATPGGAAQPDHRRRNRG
jgi:hypothetical protein